MIGFIALFNKCDSTSRQKSLALKISDILKLALDKLGPRVSGTAN